MLFLLSAFSFFPASRVIESVAAQTRIESAEERHTQQKTLLIRRKTRIHLGDRKTPTEVRSFPRNHAPQQEGLPEAAR